jgi:hypothetical protein
MGKYEPLAQFLERQRSTSVKLSFDRIEQMLGFRLPKSAYEYEAWWSNNETGHSHARWLRAGWRTTNVDLAGRSVVFEQVAGERAAPQRPGAKLDPWGCMSDTLTITPEADLTAPSDQWDVEQGTAAAPLTGSSLRRHESRASRS